MSENKPFKLNLGALKNESSEKQPEEILNLKNIQDSSNNIPVVKKAHSLDLSQMKSRKLEKKEKKEEKIEIMEEKIEIEEEEEIKEKIEVFSNYESEFKKEKQTILQRIKKFKDFVKPKTRLGFIIMLIGITSIGIASLFILSPEIHNLSNYKTNLLLAKEKIECKIDNTKCKKIIQKIPKEIQVQKEIVQINNKTLKKEIFVIEYKTEIVNGKEVIIYNNKDYSKEEFEIKIKEIVKNKKLDKLKKFLLNSKKEINVDIIK